MRWQGMTIGALVSWIASLLAPPTEPAAYKLWYASLPHEARVQVDRICREDPAGYEPVCGGIGPLHIPLPPRIRAAVRPDPHAPTSFFATMEAWQRSLTPAQKAYVDRMCPASEDRESSALCGENTPLVVAWSGQPVVFRTGATFAFAPGVVEATDWPTAETPWIALDRNGDGAIDDATELFGSSTRLGDGTAANGFAALAALDANGDGTIDARDPAFASLLLWSDRDGDARSTPGELAPLSARIESISLHDEVVPRCDARGNCEGERGAIVWRDAAGARHEGAVVDVYLPIRGRLE